MWSKDSTRSVTASELGAAPTLAHPELTLESTDFAQKLAAGSTVQSLLGANPTQDQTNAMQDAFELLGISNRQISIYAQKSAEGGYDRGGTQTQQGKDAQATLVVAGRIRAAVDSEGPGELGAYSYTIFGEKFGNTSLADDFSANGIIKSVEQGSAASKQYYQPNVAAQDMIFGASPTGIARSRDAIFPDELFQLDTYGADAKKGAAALATTSVTTFSPPGAALSEKAKDAANILTSLNGNWTPQTTTIAFTAADALLQGIEPQIQANLNSFAAQNPGYQTPTDAAATYRSAVNEALAAHGVTTIDAQGIGEKLLEAATSPAFQEAIGRNQDSANAAYTIMSSFDPEAVQRAGVVSKLSDPQSTPEGQVEQQTTRLLLTQMASSPAPAPGTPLSVEDKQSAASVIAQWSIASARWALAALSKGAGGVQIPDLDSKMQAFNNFVQQARPNVVDGTYRNAQDAIIGTSMADVYRWAGNAAGLGSNPYFKEWLSNAGASLAKGIDTYGIGAIGAAASAATRLYRLANPGTYKFDATTTAQLIASTVADAGIVTEWATQASRLGPKLAAGIAALETAIPSAGFFSRGTPVPDPVIGLANMANWEMRGLRSWLPPPAIRRPSGPPAKWAVS